MGACRNLLTIGEVAERADVATSTIRYYERLTCSSPMPEPRDSADTESRRSESSCSSACSKTQGSPSTTSTESSTHRRQEWKAIATRRLEVLDEEIATLQQARAYLAGALLCRFDHPATDCKIMGAEIDRRLSESNGAE